MKKNSITTLIAKATTLLLFLVLSSIAYAAPNLTISSTQAWPGLMETITIDYQTDQAVSSLQFDLVYDATQLETNGLVQAGAAVGGHQLDFSFPQAGTVRVSLTPPINNATISPGILLRLPITFTATSTGTPQSLSLNNVVFGSSAAIQVTQGVLTAGQITKKTDTDGDLIPDEWEIAHGLNPNDPTDADQYTDTDALNNREEFLAGTDPILSDSDGDGVTDGLDAFPNDPVRSTVPIAVDGELSLPSGTVEAGQLLAVDGTGFVIVTQPSKGYVLLHDAVEGHYLYYANVGEIGIDTFTFRAIDEYTESNLATITITLREDKDNDGIADVYDNCLLVKNTDQMDTNDDGFGNVCDPDLNNDGWVNFGDLALIRLLILDNQFDADYDLNLDGFVDTFDLDILRGYLFFPPGP